MNQKGFDESFVIFVSEVIMMADICRRTVLAHISDVHLPTPRDIPARDLINKRLLSLLSWKLSRQHRHLPVMSSRILQDIREQNPDMILNTGDITNLGHPLEFHEAARWLRALPCPSCLVPGNHDALIRLAIKDGWGHLSPWITGTEDAVFPFTRRVGDVAIIGVNSAVPTPPFMAWGTIDAPQAKRLHVALEATRGLFRIVMIHHPPRRSLVKPRKSLKDAGLFSHVLRQAGAELVLHGHSHDETLSHVDETVIPLLGVASASMRSLKPWRRASWNRIIVETKASGWSVSITQRRVGYDGRMSNGLTQNLDVPDPSK